MIRIIELSKSDIKERYAELLRFVKDPDFLDFKGLHITFGVLADDDLVAIGSLACYHGSWCMRSCYVKQEYRGLGIQYLLLQKRISYLKAKGVQFVNAWVAVDNVNSLNNVTRAGFRFVKGPLRKFHRKNHHKLRLELNENVSTHSFEL